MAGEPASIWFVDTSAFLAVLHREDEHHAAARGHWEALLQGDSELRSTNYVVVETTALAQHRFGLEALRVFHKDVLPVLMVEWIDEEIHRAAVLRLFAAGRRKLSLVDCTSVEVMHRRGIQSVFAFDKRFEEEGFDRAP